ncbi:MAG: molybdopterin cofactor-binding domain-containing protein, partial [Candidatus Tectomicrobia bacterium]
VHAAFQGIWVRASYPLSHWVGYDFEPQLACDGIALRRAGAEMPLPLYEQILRKDTIPPPKNAHNYGRSLYAPSGTLAAVEVEKPSGRVHVVELVTWLDAGTVLQPELVQGMYEGGATMGIGYALLEDLPMTTDGAGFGALITVSATPKPYEPGKYPWSLEKRDFEDSDRHSK